MAPRSLGNLLLILGAVALLAGVVLRFFPLSLAWLGHLPGDFQIELDKRGRLYLPLGTSLLVSLVLSLFLTLLVRLIR